MTNTNSAESSAGECPEAILAFWFGAGEERGKRRAAWFKKDAAFDDEIRSRFLVTHELAASGQLVHWNGLAQTCLALIVVLDQFPRNMFRGSPRAFAADALARETTLHALEHGFDTAMKPVERQFIYLPLEHSEALDDQQQCLTLMQSLSEFPETRDLHVWAEKHLLLIERFGRFPHRNTVLGRESTLEEIEFLKLAGSGF